MENLRNIPTATPESVWAILQETAQLQKEYRAEAEKSRIEAEKSRIKNEKSRIESEKQWEKMRIENEKKWEKSRIDFEEEMKKYRAEAEKSRIDFDRRMAEIQKMVGGISYNQGSFAEEYFFNSFEEGKKNFFGEKFDEIAKHLKNRWQGIEDEYDIVLYNHASVAIIEVKYKAHINDIPTVLKKAETFRVLFPHYKNFKIYLGLASMSFYPELEQECIKQGIAVVKQVGDTVVINDNNLKAF